MSLQANSTICHSTLNTPLSSERNDSRIADSSKMLPKRTIFVGGFVDRRLHNQALMKIVEDLLPLYYVTCNPTCSQTSTRAAQRQLMADAQVCVFLMNEFSLSDKRCLLTIQNAWELMVPILMLRPPRMQLIIQPATANADKVKFHGHTNSGARPDMTLLREVLYAGYQKSLIYDRFQHEVGVRQLKSQLRILLERPGDADSNNGLTESTNCGRQSHIHLKLPPIVTGPGPIIYPGYGPSFVGRSRSVDFQSTALARPRNHSKPPVINGGTNAKRHRSQTAHVLSRRRSKPPETTPFDPFNARGEAPPDPFHNHSTSSLDDQSLYHQTQYLVFPVQDKSQKPRLVRFPSDVIEKSPEELNLESVWGSDTSLEEEERLAPRLRGGLDVSSPPAPYIDPL